MPSSVRPSSQRLIDKFSEAMLDEPLPEGFELTPELTEASGEGGMLGSFARAVSLRR
jgi:hypothetical protein